MHLVIVPYPSCNIRSVPPFWVHIIYDQIAQLVFINDSSEHLSFQSSQIICLKRTERLERMEYKINTVQTSLDSLKRGLKAVNDKVETNGE